MALGGGKTLNGSGFQCMKVKKCPMPFISEPATGFNKIDVPKYEHFSNEAVSLNYCMDIVNVVKTWICQAFA